MLVLCGLVLGGNLALAQSSTASPGTDEGALEYFIDGQKKLGLDQYVQAAEAFARAHDESVDSSLAGNSLYWQAFAQYRQGRMESLRAAERSLEHLLRTYPNSGSAGDALQLYTQIRARLASLGDAAAASQLANQAMALEESAAQLAKVREQVSEFEDQREIQEDRQRLQELETQIRETRHQIETTGEKALQARYEAEEAYRRMRSLLIAEHPELLLGSDALADPLATLAAPEKEVDDLRIAALNSLFRMDPQRAVPILEEILARTDEASVPLRVKATMILAIQDTKETPDLLIKIIREDPSAEVRRRALEAISRYDRPGVADLLMEIILNDPHEDLKEAACAGLVNSAKPAQVRHHLYKIGSSAGLPSHIREHAIMSLARHGDEETFAFLRDLYETTPNRDIRLAIAVSIGRRADDETRRWLQNLVHDSDTDPEIRQRAFYWVGNDKRTSTKDLVELYGSFPPGPIRKQAVHVIGSREDDAALDFLLKVARDESDPEARLAAVYWIGQIPDDRAVAFIKEILRDQ